MLHIRKHIVSFGAIILILAPFLFFSSQIFAADFLPVWQNTILPHEGGYSNNIHDPGNWTGGKEGVGRFLGTKYGIAASTYGTSLLKQGLIIKHLTPDQARAIYERDYWRKFHFEKLNSQGIADELCDEAVNMGGAGAERLLTKVFIEIYWTGKPIPPIPAKLTPETIQWINDYTKERSNRVAFFNSIRNKRVRFYVELVQRKPKMRQFFYGWIKRCVD